MRDSAPSQAEVLPPPPGVARCDSGVRAITPDHEFDRVFRQHAAHVMRALPRLGVPPGEVDDVCQEVFVVVHRMLPGFEGRSTLKTWIYGITLRVARSYMRRAYRRRELTVEYMPEPRDLEPVPCSLERSDNLGLLDQALSKLNERQRELIVLFEIEDLTVAEIAEATETSRFTIYSRLYAARRELKRHVMRQMRMKETLGS